MELSSAHGKVFRNISGEEASELMNGTEFRSWKSI